MIIMIIIVSIIIIDKSFWKVNFIIILIFILLGQFVYFN